MVYALSKRSPQGIIIKILDHQSINKDQILVTLVETIQMGGIWKYLKTNGLPNNLTKATKDLEAISMVLYSR